MSIYENISLTEIIKKRPFRIISNIWYSFISGPKAGKPFKIKFESSTLCNLKCVMCPLTKGLDRKRGVLKFRNFKKVYEEIKPPYINLTGLGEPLLNPEIFEIIKYARKKGSLVKLDTNAMLLDKEKIVKLIQSDPTFISISLDGISKKIYESIRKGANFEKVIENLRNLIKYRNKTKSKTQIHLFFVLQKNNFRDLTKLIKFGENIGIGVINGTVAMSFGKAKNEGKREISISDINKLKIDLIKLKKEVKIGLNIENIEEFLNNPKDFTKTVKNKPCFYPWYNPCITWDGYVVPCDVHCNNEIVYGNAFQGHFMNIWNNKKAQDFRKQLLKRRVGVCSNCMVEESFILDKMKILYKIPILRSLSYRKLK